MGLYPQKLRGLGAGSHRLGKHLAHGLGIGLEERDREREREGGRERMCV
jgi:hypothetical protein